MLDNNGWPLGHGMWPNVEQYWPRRLLHIPTMTSVLRTGKGSYQASEYPRYSILSYTWGRWELPKHGEVGKSASSRELALPIQATTWEIPMVDGVHFTVRAFQDALEVIRKNGTDWVWLDIACIDQENDAVKMDEVGRQASIFKQASRAYIWLCRLPEGYLGEAYGTLRDAGDRLDQIFIQFNPERFNSKDTLTELQRIDQSISTILNDTWFSSLWTLQEMMMRDDALILTKEGQEAMITIRGEAVPRRCFMEDLMLACIHTVDSVWYAHSKLCGPSYDDGSTRRNTLDMLAAIRDRVSRSGLDSAFRSTDPNRVYAAAKFRQTRYAEDRIYGIMQMYNLRVGQAARPSERPSLDMLRVEFGLAINLWVELMSGSYVTLLNLRKGILPLTVGNRRSALRGQLFVHTAKAKPGLSWCISEESAVPVLLDVSTTHNVTARINPSPSGGVHATGNLCNFQEFYDAHIAATDKLNVYVHLDFALDLEALECVSTQDRMTRPAGMHRRTAFHSPWRQDGAELLGHFGSGRLSVLLLGDLGSGSPGNPLWKSHHYGLLLKQTPIAPGPQRPVYARLGVCVWRMMRSCDNFIADDGGEALDDAAEMDAYERTHNYHRENPLNMRKYTLSITRLFSEVTGIELN